MSQDRQEKMRQLKLKAKRKELAGQLTCLSPSVTYDSFLSVDETITLSKTLYQLLSTLPVTRQLGKGHDEAYQALVQVNSQLGKVSDEHVVLLHLQDRDSGAVVIKVSDYLEHLQMLMDFAGFFIGRRDFVLVHPELDFGICIERFEYHNNLVVWGL